MLRDAADPRRSLQAARGVYGAVLGRVVSPTVARAVLSIEAAAQDGVDDSGTSRIVDIVRRTVAAAAAAAAPPPPPRAHHGRKAPARTAPPAPQALNADTVPFWREALAFLRSHGQHVVANSLFRDVARYLPDHARNDFVEAIAAE
jgi:hypothetical protein